MSRAYDSAIPSPGDNSATMPYSVLGEQVTMGHLVRATDLLAEIRDNTERSADAEVEFVGLVREALESATYWLRVGVLVGGALVALVMLGLLFVLVALLLVR